MKNRELPTGAWKRTMWFLAFWCARIAWRRTQMTPTKKKNKRHFLQRHGFSSVFGPIEERCMFFPFVCCLIWNHLQHIILPAANMNKDQSGKNRGKNRKTGIDPNVPESILRSGFRSESWGTCNLHVRIKSDINWDSIRSVDVHIRLLLFFFLHLTGSGGFPRVCTGGHWILCFRKSGDLCLKFT